MTTNVCAQHVWAVMPESVYTKPSTPNGYGYSISFGNEE